MHVSEQLVGTSVKIDTTGIEFWDEVHHIHDEGRNDKVNIQLTTPVFGYKVRLQRHLHSYQQWSMSLCEVEVYGAKGIYISLSALLIYFMIKYFMHSNLWY